MIQTSEIIKQTYFLYLGWAISIVDGRLSPQKGAQTIFDG